MNVNPTTLIFENLTGVECCELLALAEAIVTAGKVPLSSDKFVKEWLDASHFDDTQFMLVVSTAFPQRVLLSVAQHQAKVNLVDRLNLLRMVDIAVATAEGVFARKASPASEVNRQKQILQACSDAVNRKVSSHWTPPQFESSVTERLVNALEDSSKCVGKLKSTLFTVAISTCYFMKPCPDEEFGSFQYSCKIRATSRQDAARQVWAREKDTILPMLLPSVKQVSLHVNNPADGVGGHIGRLEPITMGLWD